MLEIPLFNLTTVRVGAEYPSFRTTPLVKWTGGSTMQGPFRSDHQALAAQCDALRRQLERAEASAAELAALRAELEEKLARLADARVTELERSEAARRARGRGFRLGAAVVVLCAGAGALLLKLPGPGPAVPETGAAWFERARPHCNPVEVALWLRS